MDTLSVTTLRAAPSAATLAWLDTILKERLGRDIALAFDAAEGHFIISAAGSSRVITIESDFGAFMQGEPDLPCDHWDARAEGWHSALESPLPAPGRLRAYGPLIKPSATGYVIRYDLITMAYWMLSRYEELGRTGLDGHGRFPATASHAHRYGYLDRPVVDEWLHILRQIAERLWPGIALTANQFSIRVSHDVDWPSRYGFGTAGQMLHAAAADILKRRDLRGFRAPLIWRRSQVQLHPADPFNTFDWLMDQSERHSLRSAFYFICGRTNATRDAWYEPEAPAIRALMRRIHERGHEIGLHASYDTYRSPAALAQEAKRLKRICGEEGIHQECWGGRMHYLRWETPTTLHGWALAGMDYDSTLSYADAAGFRCGTCFSYPAFDAQAGEPLPLRIVPLIAMEQSVISSAYGNLGVGTAALEKFSQLKNACAAVGGCFTLLWHNSQLETRSKRTLYSAVLAES